MPYATTVPQATTTQRFTGRAPVPSRLRGLDGLRALAVTAVLVFHANPDWLPGGFLGVDIFFAISGFLITTLLLAERRATGRISLAAFYRRRARRLLPALGIVLVVVAVAVALFRRTELVQFRQDLAACLVYGSNWWYIFDSQSYFQAMGPPSPLAHLWSLAIEEQFYLLWPLALIALLGWRSRTGRVAWWAFGGALASTLVMGILATVTDVPYGADSARVYFGTDTHAMGLLLGAAAAAVVARRQGRSRRRGRWRRLTELPAAPWWLRPWWLRHPWWAELAGLASLAGLAWALVNVDEYRPGLYRGGFLAVAALSTVAILAVVWRGSLLGLALEAAPLRWLGRRSYEVYLWHWPVFLFIDLDAANPTLLFVLRLVVTFGLASFARHWVEVLRHRATKAPKPRTAPVFARSRLGRRPVRVNVAALLVVAGVAITGLALSRPALPAPSLTDLSAGGEPGTGGELGVGGLTAADPTPARTPTPSPIAPPVAPVAKAPKTRHVYQGATAAFGDSVILGASDAIREVIPKLSVYATVGVQADVVFGRVRDAKANGWLPPVVVIHTGNNGVVNPSDLNWTLDELRDRMKVVIVNDRLPRSWQTPNNRTFARAVASHPNCVLFDWNSLATGHRPWFAYDDVHLQPAGAQVYAANVVNLIDPS